MLDKQNEEFEKVFVHDSWKKLQKKLDVQLPVAKPATNPWFRFLIVTQILTVGLIAYLLLDKQDIPYAQVTKEKVNVKHVYHTKTIASEPATIIKYIEVPSKTQSIVQNNNIQNSSEKIISGNSLTIIPATIVERLNPNNNILNKIYPTKSLMSHSILDFQFADTNFTSADQNQIKKIINNGVDFRIGLLGSSTKDTEFTGYGVIGSFQINLNKKLGISSGIGFNHLSREFIFMPLIPNIGRSKEEAVSTQSLDSQLTFYRSLQDLKQVYIPFSISYNVSKKFSVMTGFKFRYTFDSEVDKSLTSKLSRSIKAVNDPEDIYFNNTNFGVGMGISYAVSPKIIFELDSEFGINSLINNNQFTNNRLPSYDLNLFNFTTHYKF